MKRFFYTLFLLLLLGALAITGYYTWDHSASEQKRLADTASRIDDLQQFMKHISPDKTEVSASEDSTEEAPEALLDETGSVPVSEIPETEGISHSAKNDEAVYEEDETESELDIPSDHQIIFVGDSRTVGMGEAVEDNCFYIGEVGEGYTWLIEYGIDLMDEAITAHPDLPVVFNLGVNDCDAIRAYIDVYTTIMAAYSDTSFYIMSVNPVTEDSLTVPDSDVIAFNEKMQEAFPDQFIDTYSWMQDVGFESVDGVHYSWKQYRRIHNYAVREVLKREESAEKDA